MQTFLPSPSFARSARLLDSRRLGKQRVEVLQILRALHVDDYGWRNHPAVCMWRGYTEALVAYGVEVTREWQRRGYGDTVLAQLLEFVPGAKPRPQRELEARGELPPWLGSKRLHRSHRSALLRKDRSHYGRVFSSVPDDLPYFWPPHARPAAEAAEPFSSWVVRAGDRATVERFRRRGIVALAALDAGENVRPTSKAARQVTAFRDLPQIGDPVIVPIGDELMVGEIAGRYRRVRAASPHVRDVRWLDARARRNGLSLPGRLQDPRLFFALRGERDPRTLPPLRDA